MKHIYKLSLCLLFFAFVGLTNASAQIIYYSKAEATDFNNTASWGTAVDGSGTIPPSVSYADEFIISNGSMMVLTGDVTVRRLTINSGSLTVSAFKLMVDRPGYKTTSLVIDGGTLTVTGGTVEVGGRLRHMSGEFNQSGGSIIIDPNYYGDYNKSATEALRISSPTAPNWTGGSITIVDPVVNTISSNPTIFYNSPAITEVSTNHTFKFGNGVSSSSSGFNQDGFVLKTNGGGNINFGNVEVFGPSGNGRHLNGGLRLKGNLTVHPDAKINNEDVYTFSVGGNVNVMPGGMMHAGINFTLPQGATAIANPNPQTFTIHDGAIVTYPADNPKTNLWTLYVNNSSAEGVTFVGTTPIPNQPLNSLSVFGGMRLSKGKVSGAGSISSFILGSTIGSVEGDFIEGGFAPGTILGKWYSNTLGGAQFAPGTDGLSNNFTTFPFINNEAEINQVYINRVNPVNAQGIIAVTYTSAPGTTQVDVTDVTSEPNYTVNRKANDTWSVSVIGGTPLEADSFDLQIVAPGLFGGTLTSPNIRVIQGETFIGTHELGTVTPGGHRLGLTADELIAAPFTLAINSNDVILGTKNVEKDEFSIYPNPVKEMLYISGTEEFKTIKVYSQLGQEVLTRELNKPEAAIDMSGLRAGIYILTITTGNKSKTAKVVKL